MAFYHHGSELAAMQTLLQVRLFAYRQDMPLKVLKKMFQDFFSGLPRNLRHDDEDKKGTDAEAEPGGGSRRHKPER
jgi:hypothetical protein